MKLQYLGTAAAEGWPGLFCRCPACLEAARRGGKNLRSRSQAIVDDELLLDFGPDTLMHVYLYHVNLPELKHCLITHTHEDHFYLDDLKMRCPWFASNVDDVPFAIYGSDAMTGRMEAFRREERGEVYTKGIVWRELKEYETYQIGGYSVTPTIARHDPKEKCFNYIVEKDGKTLFYGHDSALFDESVWPHFAGFRFDFVSLDCTMLQHGPGATHMNIDQCCEVRQRMLDSGCAGDQTQFCINHFSHNGAVDSQGRVWLHEELTPYMRQRGFLVSYDGMSVTF